MLFRFAEHYFEVLSAGSPQKMIPIFFPGYLHFAGVIETRTNCMGVQYYVSQEQLQRTSTRTASTKNRATLFSST